MEYTKDNPLRCFFAFEGYNSQGLALERMRRDYPDFDWVCVGRSEIDKHAIQAADALFPEAKDKNYGDISKIDWSGAPDFDLFTMSSPCQDFSQAGLQKGGAEGSGTRSSLLWECRRAILAKKPKYIVFENVKALVSRKFLPCFLKWQNELASYGYSNYAKVLNAKDYGVPQHRERVFMVSILDENASYHFPKPFPLEKKLKDVLESNVDEKYYLSEKCINGFLAHAERHKNDGFKFSPTDGNVIANTILASSQCRPCDNFIKVIGNMYDCGKQAGRIYDSEGISPTLDNMASGGNKSPKIVVPNFGNQRLNEMLKTQDIPLDEPVCIDTYNQCVKKGVFCTLKSNIDRENLKYVTEPLSCAMRGRNLDSPSDRVKGCVTGQRLEIGDDKANTITTVQKDSMVVEPINTEENGVSRTIKSQYYKNGLSNFVRQGTMGATEVIEFEPQILTPKRNEYGKAVRKEYESGRLNVSRHNMTDLTPREDGISNTITSVQKDNLLFEPKQVIGSTQKNAFIGDVDGIAPTINAACGMGGGQTPMILGVTVNPNRKREYKDGRLSEEVSPTITCQEAKNTSFVYERNNRINYKITENGKIRAYQNDDKKSGVSEFQIDNEEAIASTVTTAHTPKCYGESMGFRIRKLTPRECFRLMGVSEEDIDTIQQSGISKTQQYKMAGNSIVVDVLYHIFRKLFVDNGPEDMTLF